ncbi:MAG: hypothetical protein QOE61_1387 [Micromonosporaceae bacterium]|nr:hypothetical protein [Micromonosporaceae bacterium]
MRVQADSVFDGVLAHDARRLHVDATSTSALRASLSGPLARVRSRRVTIDVASWQAPRPWWSARLGPLPGVTRHEVRLPDLPPGAGPGRARVRVVLAEPLPFYLVASAALQALTSVSRLPAPVSPDVAAYGQPPPWLPPWANVAGVVGDPPDEKIIRPYDVLLTDAVAAVHPSVAGPVEVAAHPWGVAGKVVVDATVTNPRGYLTSSDVDASLEVSPAGLTVRAGAGGFETVLAPLAPDRIEAVRALRSIRVDALDGTDAATEAVVLAQLAMHGVVVHTPTALPGAVAGRLAAELTEIFAETLPPGAAPATEWEARSVRQRRTALRGHATAWALPALADLPAELRTPSVSLVLAATRPEQVRAALAMLSEQTYPSLELVLALPAAVLPSVVPSGVEVVRTEAGAEEAFAAAAGRARGSLITRIEPDALYGNDHVWDLVLALHYSGAAVVGKACEFFRRGQATAVRRPAAASESFTDAISDGTDAVCDGPLLLARADLAAAGGWRHIASGPGYRTHPFGFVRPEPAGESADHAASRSVAGTRTYPLTLVTS